MGGEKQKKSFLLDDETTMVNVSPGAGTLLWLGRTARLGAAAAALIALLGLLAYLPGLRVLGSIRPNYIPMAPSTAASFLILGAAIFRLALRRWQGKGLNALVAAVMLVMLFSLLNLAGNIVGLDLNWEARLAAKAGALGGIPIGRMSPMTGAAFFLAGMATLLLLLGRGDSRVSRRPGHWASSLGVLTVLGGSTVLLSYLIGSPLMYSGTAVPMAATTAIGFLCLGTALVAAAGPESHPMRWVMGDATSARLSRVFFPLTVAVVIVQGVLTHLISASNAIHNALVLAALAIAVGTITVALVVRVAHSLGRSLDEAKEALRESEERYREIFDTSPDAILLTAPDGRILAVNPSACRLFEQTEEEIQQKGRSGILDTSDPRLAAALTQRERMGKFNGELTLVRKSGTRFPGEISSIIFKDKEGRARTSMVIRDISERKQAEEEIQRQLAEKEVLLKEVHHRIKNNIASIGGLLSLHLRSINNPEAIAALQDAIGRVDSMRILYDKLLLTKGYETISLKNYIESLADGIVDLFPDHAKIMVEKNIADIHLDPKRLFPLGLIINELLTNKMKYAFTGRERGRIRISLSQIDQRVRLILQDDGVGLPQGFAVEKSAGFGLMLVNMLRQQLGGSFSIETHEGTRSVLEFPL